MATPMSPLDREADFSTIQELLDQGILSPEAREQAMQCMIPPPARWREWADRLLMSLGTALLVAGIIFFFAYNWDQMQKWGKFVLVESALLISLLAVLRQGIDTMSGRVAFGAAAVLVGAFLAVFGQIYQTGADAWQLFAGWAGLILPWAIISRMSFMLMLQTILVQLSVGLYAEQVAIPARMLERGDEVLLVALVGLVAVVLQEGLWQRGLEWAKAPWVSRVFFLSCLLPLWFQANMFVWRDSTFQAASTGAGFVLYLALSVAGGWWFWAQRRDFPTLTFVMIAGAIFLNSALFRVLTVGNHGPEVGALFLMAGAAIISFGGLALGLKRLVEIDREERGG